MRNFTVSSLVASSDDHKRAQRNVILMKAQAWLEQDVYDGPGCAWPAGVWNKCLGSLQTQEFQKILVLKSLTQKERWAAGVGGGGGVGAVIIVSDCIVESSPGSEMCVDQHGQLPRPLPTISHLIHLTWRCQDMDAKDTDPFCPPLEWHISHLPVMKPESLPRAGGV